MVVAALHGSEVVIEGVTRPYRETTLSAAAPGIIATLPVREGDVVKKGQVVVELRSEHEALEVKRRTLLYQNESELQSAAARVATAQSEYESTLKVFEATGSVSREELDRKKLQYDLAIAEQLLARMNKERERLEMAIAEEALERRRVRSPLDGVVAGILIEEGEGCEVRQPLIVVVDTRQLIFQVNLEARELARFAPGQSVAVEIEYSGGLRALDGVVEFVSPVVDRASGLGVLKVRVANDGGQLWAGVGGQIKVPAAADSRP